MGHKKTKKRVLIVFGIIIGLIILWVGAAVIYSLLRTTPSIPVVTIHTPTSGEQIALGEVVSVQSTSRDEEHFIIKVELWQAQGEYMQLVGMDEPIEPGHVISLPQGWQPLETGSYRLILRVFNDQGNYGQAAVDVMVVETPTTGEVAGGEDDLIPPDEDEGEMLPPPGGFDWEGKSGVGYNPEESVGGESSPGLEPTAPPSGSQPPQPEPEPPPETSGFDLTGLVIQGLGDIITPEAYMEWLRLEVISFEVNANYDSVYCYATYPGHPWRRVPESGSLDTSDQFQWNLEDYLGGENSVEIQIFQEQSLEMSLVCYAYFGNNLFPFGEIDVSHPSQDWNGQLIHASSGPGFGFTITYHIVRMDPLLPPPMQLNEIQWGGKRYFQWGWEGDPNWVDGFRIYRDNTLVASVSSEARVFEIPMWWTVPPCNEEYDYYVVAYKDQVESPSSNHLSYQGGVCKGEADIISIAGIPNCGGTGQRFVIQYDYAGEGPAYIRLKALQDGRSMTRVLTEHTQISHGVGTVQLAMTYHGTEPLATDEIMVRMYDEDGQDFYVESFDRTIEWTPGTPDLVITQASVDRENHKLIIGVRNEGCACPPVENAAVSIERQADGWTGFDVVEGNLFARSGALIEMDLLPDEMSLWGGRIILRVDPNNQTEESNEGNNSFTIGAARIKAVQLYKIIIYDDHDAGSNKGEMHVVFNYSSGSLDYIRGPWDSVTSREYQWGEGEHLLYDWFHYPRMSEDDFLKIRIGLWENDDLPWDYRNQYMGDIYVTHSPDPTQENSWKGGGEFEFPSPTWDFKAFYRIILE